MAGPNDYKQQDEDEEYDWLRDEIMDIMQIPGDANGTYVVDEFEGLDR